MRRIILYIATSLDGYIARPDGSIDWLPQPSGTQDYGYARFMRGIDTVVMGRKTYDLAQSFESVPFPGKQVIVFTHHPLATKDPRIRFVHGSVAGILRRLRRQSGKGIWIVGGSDLVRQCNTADLVDEYIITICPVLIGEGIKLFLPVDEGPSRRTPRKTSPLRLISVKHFNDGLVQLKYMRDAPPTKPRKPRRGPQHT